MSVSYKVAEEFAAECLAVAKSKGISEGVFAKTVIDIVKGVCLLLLLLIRKIRRR